MFFKATSTLQTEDDRRLNCANTLIESVRKKYPKGSSNKPGADKDLWRTISFYRAVHDSCMQTFAAFIGSNNHIQRECLFEMVGIILSASLGELYGCGNCGEYTASVFTEIIEQGVQEPTELMIYNGNDNGFDDRHHFVVQNRNLASDSMKPETWSEKNKTAIVIDPWLNKQAHKADQLKQSQLHQPGLKVTDAEANIKLTKALTKKDFIKIARSLKIATAKLDEKIIQHNLTETNVPHLKAKEELVKIKNKIAEKIKLYKEFLPESNVTFFSAQRLDTIVIYDKHFAQASKSVISPGAKA